MGDINKVSEVDITRLDISKYKELEYFSEFFKEQVDKLLRKQLLKSTKLVLDYIEGVDQVMYCVEQIF